MRTEPLRSLNISSNPYLVNIDGLSSLDGDAIWGHEQRDRRVLGVGRRRPSHPPITITF